MRKDTIGVAIVGTGFMGWVHAEALRRLPAVSLVGVCGSSGEKSRALANDWGVDKAYDHFTEVLEDDEVDAVHIATPNRLHYEMARAAIVAGKHVLCEKPLSMTIEESADLVQLAAEHPQQATAVNYNIRFYPLLLQAKQMIVDAGELGRVVHVSGSYTQDWLTDASDYNWRVLADVNGPLRAVADIGTHWLDLMHFVTGLRVEAVFADLKTVHPTRYRPLGEVETFSGEGDRAKDGETEDRVAVEIATEDYGCVMLRFAGGTRGVFHVSQVMPGRKNCLQLEIAGAEKSLVFNSETPNELWVGNRHAPNATLVRDPALLQGDAARYASYPGGHNEGYADSFKQCFRAFYDAIAAGKSSFDAVDASPLATFADGHREIVMCEAILRSHHEQRWVSLPL